MMHKYTLHEMAPNDTGHRFLIFCEHCGYVAFHGNSPQVWNEQRQRDLPTTCMAGNPAPTDTKKEVKP